MIEVPAPTSSAGDGTRPWTPTALLDWSADYFAHKGIPSPRYDAEQLLAHVLGCARLDLYLRFDQPLHPDELQRYRQLVRRRAEREPVAYLTGEAGFWELTLPAAGWTPAPSVFARGLSVTPSMSTPGST